MIEIRRFIEKDWDCYNENTKNTIKRVKGEKKLQYRFIQPTADAYGALRPGGWSEWIDVPDVYEE